MEVNKQFEFVTVSCLPMASAESMYKIFFVPATSSEYITVRSGSEDSYPYMYTYSWEKIGDTDIDFDHITEQDFNTMMASPQ